MAVLIPTASFPRGHVLVRLIRVVLALLVTGLVLYAIRADAAGQTPAHPPISPVAPALPEHADTPKTLEEQLEEALDNDDKPRAGELYTLIGQRALDNKRPGEAIISLQRALDVSPTATRARYLLASAFDAVGDAERSGREIRAAFDVDSAEARAADYALLARSVSAGGNHRSAAEVLRNAVKRYPVDVDVRLQLASELVLADESADALFELLYARMIVHRGARQESKVGEMIAKLKADTESAKDDPDPIVELTFSYLEDAESDQAELALPTIQDVVAKSSETAIAPRLLLGQCLTETGRLGEAEKVLTRLSTLDPLGVPALACLANLYYTEGRPEAAKAVVERAAKIDAQNPMLVHVVEAWK